MYVKNAVKDSITMSLKCAYMVALKLCITYLKKTKLNPVANLTATK